MKPYCDFKERLVEFLDGDISPSREFESITEHLSTCSECRRAAQEYEISLDALKAVLEAEGEMTESRSLGPILRNHACGVVRAKSGEGARWARWAAVAAIAVILIFVLIGDLPRIKSTAQEPAAIVKHESSPVLIVEVQPDSFDLEDRMDGTVRTVNVRP